MSAWQKVSGKASIKKSKLKEARSKTLSEAEVETFLASFKTKECLDTARHDFRLCGGFHSDKDRRRNPYQVYYSVDDCLNVTEKMYHPAIFRIFQCRKGDTHCELGGVCANAHSTLRDWKTVADHYEKRMFEVDRSRPLLSSFVPESLQHQNYKMKCEEVWREHQLSPSSATIRLSELEWFVMSRSNSLLRDMETLAFEEGLSCVEKRCVRGEKLLVIVGLHAQSLKNTLGKMLVPPSRYFGIEEREYGERVITDLKAALHRDGDAKFSGSKDVLVEILDESRMHVVAVAPSQQERGVLFRGVLDKIEFWMSQEGYDEFVECQCCLEERNSDQGVMCEKGHFFCSVERCFATAVQSQLLNIRKRDEWLICPQCESPYDLRNVANHVPYATLMEVFQAIIDKSVEKERTAISNEFDRKLESKVQELVSNYGNADELLKASAQKHAQTIRNTILNLACPHCTIAYAEFTGCMALECASCGGNFCAYCHAKFDTARGSHEHVRQCLMNETTTGSYYANAIEIQRAQRRYRTRELKKNIQRHKKELQNAIVTELTKDLNDLGIDPAGLYVVGNLQQE